MTSNSILSVIGALILLAIGMNLWGAVGCEAQQKANKEAFAATDAAWKADEKFKDIIDHMEYQREWIVVYIKPGSSLPEDKGSAVMFVAQTMGDQLKNHPDNKLRELIVKGNIEDEELWVIRYDMESGTTETQDTRLFTTM